MLCPYSIFQISYAGQARLPSKPKISPSDSVAKIIIFTIGGDEKTKNDKENRKFRRFVRRNKDKIKESLIPSTIYFPVL